MSKECISLMSVKRISWCGNRGVERVPRITENRDGEDKSTAALSLSEGEKLARQSIARSTAIRPSTSDASTIV